MRGESPFPGNPPQNLRNVNTVALVAPFARDRCTTATQWSTTGQAEGAGRGLLVDYHYNQQRRHSTDTTTQVVRNPIKVAMVPSWYSAKILDANSAIKEAMDFIKMTTGTLAAKAGKDWSPSAPPLWRGR